MRVAFFSRALSIAIQCVGVSASSASSALAAFSLTAGLCVRLRQHSIEHLRHEALLRLGQLADRIDLLLQA